MNKNEKEWLRKFDREFGLDDAMCEAYDDINQNELRDYTNVIVSHVDKSVPTILLALGPPLTLVTLYLVMKMKVLTHPMLVLLSVLGMVSAFYFAIKYDVALKACRYSGIGIALAERKNIELKIQNSNLSQRVGELEARLGIQPLKDEDIPF